MPSPVEVRPLVECAAPEMDVTVGTFNLNNLFSRFNFQAEIPAAPQPGTGSVTTTYTFGDPTQFRIRTFEGRLVKGKDPKDTQTIAERITAMDAAVLAVQEVEDLDTLRHFNADHLGGLYPYQVLVEGNDLRLIDVGVLSKLPIGGVTSWQKAVLDPKDTEPVFSRDLLQVEIYSTTRSRRLFTLFVNHLKSHFVRPPDTEATADSRRRDQATVAARLIKATMRPDSSFIVLGDMNDAPDTPFLAPLVQDQDLRLTNALANARESHPLNAPDLPPGLAAWTDRFKPTGQPAQYRLFDQIWLSPALSAKLSDACIERRTHLGGDGSDHDPAWIRLSL